MSDDTTPRNEVSTALLPDVSSRVASDPMFNPDLGYYLRALRSGKRVIVVCLVVGAVIGLLIGAIESGRDWEASQIIRIDKTAVSPTIDERSLLHLPQLPDRKVPDEAALLRVVAGDLDVPSAIIVVPDDEAGSIKVFASGGSKAVVTRDLQAVLDAYQKDRIDDYGRRLAEAVDVVSTQAKTSQASLDSLDSEISSTPAADTLLAQALVAQRAEVVQLVESSSGAQAYLEGFRARQTGGATLLGQPEFKQQPATGSGLTLAIVLGIVGAAIGAVIAMIRRMARRRIESAADLALFSSIVSVGELEKLDSLTFEKISTAEQPGRVIVTESLVGTAGERLRGEFVSRGIAATACSVLHLPTIGPNDRVVLAIDGGTDSERTVEDLVGMLDGVVPMPLLAVLC